MISEAHRCIFVHIPKTGGTSITKALGWIDHINHGAQDHSTIQNVRKSLPPEDFDAYFKFAFVRNPWARVASWYKNVVQDPVHRQNFKIDAECSFQEFLTRHGDIWGLQPQLHWIRDSTHFIPLDFIGRYESLHEHFELVCQRLGLANVQLPHLVKAHDSRPYTSLYDDETRDIVADRYSEEIDLFGYEYAHSQRANVLLDPVDFERASKLAVIREQFASIAQSLVDERPPWVVRGSLSAGHARFLLEAVTDSKAEVAVEIGTASGFSTAVICNALAIAHQSGAIGPNYKVASYDVATKCLFDSTRNIGDAAREQLSEELLAHVVFRNPATAADLGHFHAPNEIDFLFIDGSHRHPWATLDLLAALPYLSSEAMVVLHGINLPLLNPQFNDWGAKYLFDDLDVEKSVPDHPDLPNIGSFRIPEDKAAFKAQLLSILKAHEWRANVSDHFLSRLGLSELVAVAGHAPAVPSVLAPK